MVNNASRFTHNRTDVLSITNQRIKRILWYIIECHLIFINDNKIYSLKELKSNSKIKPEEYFRTKFVDEYLRRNKHLLQIFQMEDVFFGKEESEFYKDNFRIEQEDFIDIYIRDSGLQSYWGNKEEVYFAIECKRIKQLSDARDYVTDIEKFCNRSHINMRLPFEGQIAFIENPKLTQTTIVDKINSSLHSNNYITTNSYLTSTKIHSTLDCSYLSTHKKNFSPNQKFSIYHLMFDYSKVVLDS